MIKPVSYERWQKAQEAERSLHTKSLEEGLHHYHIAYGHNFRYLGIDPEQIQNGICEIGCADFPALRFCNIGYACCIIEPMASDYLNELCNDRKIKLITERFEYLDEKIIPYNNSSEIWIFNVLQHVGNPELFIQLAKRAKTIRYFEPIDTEITDYHPHSFTQDDFERWFPGVNKHYNETTNECFHNGPCCYGVYNR